MSMKVDVTVGFSLGNVGVCTGLLCAWRKEHMYMMHLLSLLQAFFLSVKRTLISLSFCLFLYNVTLFGSVIIENKVFL